MTFVPDAERAKAMHADYGVSVFFIASEHMPGCCKAHGVTWPAFAPSGNGPAVPAAKRSDFHQVVAIAGCDEHAAGLPQNRARPLRFYVVRQVNQDEKNTHSLRPCSGVAALVVAGCTPTTDVSRNLPARDRAGRGCAAAELGFR
jgi:hypothetical protein